MKAKETKKTKKTTAKKPATTKKAVKKPVVKAKKTPKTKKAVKTTAKTPKKTAVKRSEPKKVVKPTKEVILRKSGLDKQGNQKYTEYKVYKRKPKGWKENKGATTAPRGYKWIHNGKSLFSAEYKAAFLKVDD